jgi:hypothetical protein
MRLRTYELGFGWVGCLVALLRCDTLLGRRLFVMGQNSWVSLLSSPLSIAR